MFRYYLLLAWRSVKSAPGISSLMVGAVALGIGVSMTIFSTYFLMSADPIPQKSGILFNVMIDSWDPQGPFDEDNPELPPPVLTFRDTQAILGSGIPEHEAPMYKSGFLVFPDSQGVNPFFAPARLTSSDFFSLFDVPFDYGNAWSHADYRGARSVVVISAELNNKLFGGKNSVGKTLTLNEELYTIVGVRSAWNPKIRFYDLENEHIANSEDIYAPFSLFAAKELPRHGNTNCWKDEEIRNYQDLLGSECIWPSVWVELNSEEQKQRYRDWLDAYVMEQQTLGRLPRPLNNHLLNVTDYMVLKNVVDKDTRMMVIIAFLFLTVCLVNMMGLLLARFLGKSAITGVRRALGASRLDIVFQHLTEVAVIGALGGAFGLLISLLGLQFTQSLWPHLAEFTKLDGTLILMGIGISVMASVIAGLYPTWRICQLPPARHLKIQ